MAIEPSCSETSCDIISCDKHRPSNASSLTAEYQQTTIEDVQRDREIPNEFGLGDERDRSRGAERSASRLSLNEIRRRLRYNR
jgi:hypothetical protein